MKDLRKLSYKLLTYTQDVGLFIISIFTVIAISSEVMVIIEARQVKIADLLLLFIYLEILAMVAVYLKSGRLPVRYPLYIAIVALARYLILDMKNLDSWRMLAVAAAALLIAVAILVVRYGHTRFPYNEPDES